MEEKPLWLGLAEFMFQLTMAVIIFFVVLLTAAWAAQQLGILVWNIMERMIYPDGSMIRVHLIICTLVWTMLSMIFFVLHGADYYTDRDDSKNKTWLDLLLTIFYFPCFIGLSLLGLVGFLSSRASRLLNRPIKKA